MEFNHRTSKHKGSVGHCETVFMLCRLTRMASQHSKCAPAAYVPNNVLTAKWADWDPLLILITAVMNPAGEGKQGSDKLNIFK